jgi:hypothetical protein
MVRTSSCILPRQQALKLYTWSSKDPNSREYNIIWIKNRTQRRERDASKYGVDDFVHQRYTLQS